MTPQIGWTVHYLPPPHSDLARGPDHNRKPGMRLAAMVIGMNEDGTIDLFVFGRVGATAIRRCVHFVADTAESNINVIAGYAVPIT